MLVRFLLVLITKIADLFSAFLPVSPIQTFANDGLGNLPMQALGWLNWVIPMQDMLGIFTIWIEAYLLFITVKFIQTYTIETVVKVLPFTSD